MNITKKEIVTIKDNNENVICVGDTCYIQVENKTYIGKFESIYRGALVFDNIFDNGTFSLMPKSILMILNVDAESDEVVADE